MYQCYHDTAAKPRQWTAAYGQISLNDPHFQPFLSAPQVSNAKDVDMDNVRHAAHRQ